jgi:hypothetical protein
MHKHAQQVFNHFSTYKTACIGVLFIGILIRLALNDLLEINLA